MLHAREAAGEAAHAAVIGTHARDRQRLNAAVDVRKRAQVFHGEDVVRRGEIFAAVEFFVGARRCARLPQRAVGGRKGGCACAQLATVEPRTTRLERGKVADLTAECQYIRTDGGGV